MTQDTRLLSVQDIEAVAGGMDFIPLGPFPCFPNPDILGPLSRVGESTDSTF